jgi:hypothetical protein
MSIKITLPIAGIIAALIFCGAWASTLWVNTDVAKEAKALSLEGDKRLDKHDERLAVLEKGQGVLCDTLTELKQDVKDIRKDQLKELLRNKRAN